MKHKASKNNEQSSEDMIVKAIRWYPSDDSNKPEYTTRGHMIKSLCYSYTTRVDYLKEQYQNAYAEWELLKDKVADGLGTESASRSIENKIKFMETIKPSLKNAMELKKVVYSEHLVFFRDASNKPQHYTLPVRTVANLGSDEVTADTVPEKL